MARNRRDRRAAFSLIAGPGRGTAYCRPEADAALFSRASAAPPLPERRSRLTGASEPGHAAHGGPAIAHRLACIGWPFPQLGMGLTRRSLLTASMDWK